MRTTSFNLLTEVPVAIRSFYFEETLSEPTGNMIDELYQYMGYDEQTGEETGLVDGTRQVPEMHDVTYVRQHQPTERKSIEDLERIISLHKPLSVLDKFAYMVGTGEKWAFFEEYQEFIVATDEVTEFNNNLPVTGQDNDGNDIYAEPRAFPSEPVQVTRTGGEILAAAQGLIKHTKRQGTLLNGEQVSLTEENQNGIAAVLKGVELAAKYEQNIFPVNFKAATANGDVSIPFADQASFELFALQFMGARATFFTGSE